MDFNSVSLLVLVVVVFSCLTVAAGCGALIVVLVLVLSCAVSGVVVAVVVMLLLLFAIICVHVMMRSIGSVFCNGGLVGDDGMDAILVPIVFGVLLVVHGDDTVDFNVDDELMDRGRILRFALVGVNGVVLFVLVSVVALFVS